MVGLGLMSGVTLSILLRFVNLVGAFLLCLVAAILNSSK